MVDIKKQTLDKIYIDGHSLTTEDVFLTALSSIRKIAISEEVKENIVASQKLLIDLIKNDRIIYGVNTSLGGLVDWLVPTEQAEVLQKNLIAAVATNVGTYLDDHIVRAAMMARLNSLARGNSAISLENYTKLLDMFNLGVIPCIPCKGSLGASGDLGPLACIALVGTGEWKAKYNGKIMPGSAALQAAGIEPMRLSFKEGLSLINGTSTMVGLACILIEQVKSLVKSYDVISCLSFEALKTKKKPFNPIVHEKKPHIGQLQVAQNIWSFLSDSKMIVDEEEIEKRIHKQKQNVAVRSSMPIEDAYSIRCTPQILGPIRDSLKWINTTITNELNSSNDNPLVIPEAQDTFHNGHFHGQYISMAMDHLSIALTTLCNLSDRRIDRFMDQNNSNQLPPFLCKENTGLRLGLMGGQFMASSLTAENRSLTHPISIQTLTSTGDFQDIVSLGLVAARRAKEIYENTAYVISFELLAAAQAADIRGPQQLGKATKYLYEVTREIVPYLAEDKPLTDYLEELSDLLKSGRLIKEVECVVGEVPF